jgi:hypothetical protein
MLVVESSRLADHLQDRLRRQGIRSTVCLTPYSDEATLEIWGPVDAELLDSALSDKRS